VAVAASAGGLRAIEEVLSGLPAGFPAAVVVLLHLYPYYPSHLAEILRPSTRLKVVEALTGSRLAPATVYVAPPDRHLLVMPGGRLLLTADERTNSLRPSADRLFESLAHARVPTIAVILTGKGKDGAVGAAALKRMGGVVIAQDRSSSEAFGMPEAAIRAGCVDTVLPLGEIAARVVELVGSGDAMTTNEPSQEVEALLEYLKRNRGFDFTGYKRTSLVRRVRRRMDVLSVPSFADYTDYLEVHPEEFAHLFNSILINVTGFFRDQTAWEYLSEEILPGVVAAKRADDPIRIWSAGCASGEEPYSLAVAMAEAIGPDQFRERVKIYATDVDEDALNHARQGTYAARDISGIAPELLDRYFEQTNGRYSFHKDLRRSVIFGRHDLLQDAPISRIDLLVCRNVLMYFNADAQARILARFHFALNEGGYLFLGKAEMLLTHANLFTPVDLKRRIFVRTPRGGVRDRLLAMAQAGNDEAVANLAGHVRIREQAFDTGPVAQIVVDAAGIVVLANERARAVFGLGSRDVGRPLQDLEISYRPVELRSCIERAYSEGRTVSLKEVQWLSGSSVTYLDVDVTPLPGNGNGPLGVAIVFVDITRYKRLQDELVHSSQELETAYEELQSTNEELETMNEELQSTNEELHTTNDELRRRSLELNEVNAFLQSILASLRGGVVVLDRELRVQVWNGRSEDLWGLREEEVSGRHFLNLDIGLPVAQLHQPIRACLSGEREVSTTVLQATNRRGRAITCAVTCSPLFGAAREVRGAILLVEEQREEAVLGAATPESAAE
jgi:two-component system CheB/CheR fusion protein